MKRRLAQRYDPWRERQQRAKRRLRPRIAGIFDTMTFECFGPDVELHKIPRKNWRTFLEELRPDLVFLESAWQGNDGAWRHTMSQFAKHGDDLRALVLYCRSQNIRVVFWAKDDPTRFEIFLPVAALADVVFTTDAESVPRYRDALGHDRVHPLAFGAQPALHNPIRTARSLQRFVYPGSWHAHVHPERQNDLENLLEPILEQGRLDVFDRFSGIGKERGEFPENYRGAVHPALPYPEMCQKYREYAGVLNVNTVKASSTMCSRRVFEVLASGVPLISSPARALANFDGLVFECRTRDDVLATVQRLGEEPELSHKTAVRAIRRVHAEHLVDHRLEQVFQTALGWTFSPSRPLVSIIVVSNRPAFLAYAVDNVQRQVYPNLELVFVANSSDFDREEVARQLARLDRAKVFYTQPEMTVGECTNLGISHAEGLFFAKFDDDDYYAQHYLHDALNAFHYTQAGVVGKKSFLTHIESRERTYLRFPGSEYRYTDRVHGPTMVVDRRVWDSVKFRPLPGSGTDTQFLKDASLRCKLFSADHYNFVHFRRGAKHEHIWRISDDDFLKACQPFSDGFDPAAISV